MNLFTHHFSFINSLACKSIEINEKAYSYTAMEQMETANAIKQVFQYYQLTYERRPELQAFVQTSSRIPIKLKTATLIGASDRTLGKEIPVARTVSGGATRGLLKHVGLITTTGGEYFRGCIVFGYRNAVNQIVAATGVRYGTRIRAHEKVTIKWQLPAINESKEKHFRVERRV